MKVLVTGNLGYLGPLVVKRLQYAGHEVHGLDTGMYLHQLAERLSPDMLPQRQYFGDIRDYRAGRKYDAIVHLAGLSNDPMGELDEQETKDINVIGTLRILEQWPDARQVFASSASVYGASQAPVHVGSPLNPLTAYAKSKAAVETELRLEGYHGAVLRFGTLFGWAPNFRTDLVVNRMCYDAIVTKTVTFTQVWRPLLHVDEAAKAVLAAVESTNDFTRDVVQVSMTMGHLAQMMVKPAPNLIRLVEAKTKDTRDYRIEATVDPEPQNLLGTTITDLMKRRLPLSIRLDAYKEASH
jgi:nucleoside-diphosphate-sugar epimerase